MEKYGFPQALYSCRAKKKKGESPPHSVAMATGADSPVLQVKGGKHGGALPIAHTCFGPEPPQSPEVAWQDPVPGRAHALLMVDPDAPRQPFVHWMVWWIPPVVSGLGAGQPTGAAVVPLLPGTEDARARRPVGAPLLLLQGKNGAGTFGFYPACPPPTHATPHRYFLLLWRLALDAAVPRGWAEATLDEFQQWISKSAEASAAPLFMYAGASMYTAK